MTPEKRRDEALQYLNERTGIMEFRFVRYAAVAERLSILGLQDKHIICDVGAGAGDFDFYLRAVRGYKGRYLPVDAAIDGTELEGWSPPCTFDFITAIEVIEHLHDPAGFVRRLVKRAWRGVVITTPNTDLLGADAVRAMDRTHVRPVTMADLKRWGAHMVETRSFFGKDNDSFLAWWFRSEIK